MIFRSPYPEVAIPETALTPMLLRAAARRAGKPALIDGNTGRALTYGASPNAGSWISSAVSRWAPATWVRVRRIEIVGQVPKSPSGKILRRVLVQQERERLATRLS